MAKYLVAMAHGGKIATMVADIPEDYDFSKDYNPNSRTADFDNLKQILRDQVPSGFHKCCWMLNKDERQYTKIIAISKLGE